jgi:hypothetical protein
MRVRNRGRAAVPAKAAAAEMPAASHMATATVLRERHVGSEKERSHTHN